MDRHQNKRLVHKGEKIIVCDMYGCKKTTKYSIGHAQFPHLHLNLCKEHMVQIVADGVATLEEEKPKDEPTKKEQVNLKDLTRQELFTLCKERGITGYSKLKTAEIIELLTNEGDK